MLAVFFFFLAWETYSLGKRRSASLSTNEDNNIPCLLHILYNLPSRNITPLSIIKKCRQKDWGSWDQLSCHLLPL